MARHSSPPYPTTPYLSPRLLQIPTVTKDIYNWDIRYHSVLKRLEPISARDTGILEINRLTVKKFLESREARGLSLPRVVKYGTHPITFSRLCSKPFGEITRDDLRETLVALKNGNKMDPRFSKSRDKKKDRNNTSPIPGDGSSKYSEATIDGFKIMIKIFWRWLKGWTSPNRSILRR